MARDTRPVAIFAAADSPPWSLAVALGIGLLLGAERERRKGRGADRGAAGVRTFALVALLGALSAEIGDTAVVVLCGAFVGLAGIAAYLRSDQEDPGLTTEVALMVAFLLGVLTDRDPALAAGIAVAVAIVLASRSRLHTLVRDTLSEQELHDALLFAAAALIVLPLIPDKGVGPHDAINPLTVWRLVVIVMAVQGLGYIALRLIGPRYGLLLAGFVSGFISSTATVATMGARSKAEPSLRRSAVGAAVASTVATIILLAIVVGAASGDVLAELAIALSLSGLTAVSYAVLIGLRVARAPAPTPVKAGRAFDLKVALILAVTVTGVLLLSTLLQDALGQAGLLAAVGVAGFADSQSAAISAASLAAAGRVDVADAAIAVLVGLSTNTVSKATVAGVLGDRRYALDVWAGLALVLAAAWAGHVVDTLI